MAIQQTKTMKLSELNPAPYNPRKNLKPGDKEYDKLQNSMEAFGYIEPIIVNTRDGRNTIVGGHQRYKVLCAAGENEATCVLVDYDETTEKACNVALNKVQGDWSFTELADLLTELNTGAFDMELTGFDEDELKKMMAWTPDAGDATEDDFDADAEADAIVEPTTKRGDIWVLGKHRVMCGDSTSAADVEKLMAGKSIDLVLTDPPYGISVVSAKTKKVGAGGALHFGGTDSATKVQGDESTDTAKAMYECLMAFNPQAFIMWGGNYFTDFVPPSRCWIVWDKENTGNFADAELAWTSFDKGVKLYRWMWNGLARKGDRKSEGTTRVHPTQKPVGLHGEILKDYSDIDALVFDGFLGSGTTLIAAEQLNRVCYGMEISPVYCDVIVKRWETLTGQKASLCADRPS